MPYGLTNAFLYRRRAPAAPEEPAYPDQPGEELPEQAGGEPFPEPLDLSQHFTGSTEPEPNFIRHPALAGFLAGMVGGERGVQTLMAARTAYYTRKFREQQLSEEANRRRDEMALRYGEPSLATTPELAESIQHRRRAAPGEIPEGYVEDPFHPGRLIRQPKPPKEPAGKRPARVAPGESLVDPDTGRVIYTAPAAPPKRTAGTAAAVDRAEAAHERAVEGVGKLRNESFDLNAEMQSIRSTIAAKPAEGQRPKKWDDLSPDPKTGLPSPLTYRQRYQALKQKNDANIKEIRRLWDVGRPGRGPVPEPAAPAPAPGARGGGLQGYTGEEIEALRQAMDEDERDEFDGYTAADKQKVLDSAYGRKTQP